MMSEFWKLFKESVITQSLVTLALIITVCIMFASEMPVPDALLAIVMIVLGFWFGSKSGYYQGQAAAKSDVMKEIING